MNSTPVTPVTPLAPLQLPSPLPPMTNLTPLCLEPETPVTPVAPLQRPVPLAPISNMTPLSLEPEINATHDNEEDGEIVWVSETEGYYRHDGVTYDFTIGVIEFNQAERFLAGEMGPDEFINSEILNGNTTETSVDEIAYQLNNSDYSPIEQRAFDCPVCMMSFTEEQKMFTTSCGHVFCNRCITEWTRSLVLAGTPNCSCPICRQVYHTHN